MTPQEQLDAYLKRTTVPPLGTPSDPEDARYWPQTGGKAHRTSEAHAAYDELRSREAGPRDAEIFGGWASGDPA